jgi:hypothetical protein
MTAGRRRAARVNSLGAVASALRNEARFSVKARTPFVRKRSAGRAADFEIAVLSVVWCQNARVPYVSRSARFVLPAPAGIATTMTAANAASAKMPPQMRPGLRSPRYSRKPVCFIAVSPRFDLPAAPTTRTCG